MEPTVKKYPGQKNIPGVIHKIVNNIPAHLHYYELFAGSGAIGNFLASMAPTVNYNFNDIDPGVTDIYNYTAGSSVTNYDALDLLQLLKAIPAGKEYFLFIDPPYLHSTRPGNTAIYNYEVPEPDIIKLLLAVQDLHCNVMIIHPECELFNTYLKHFRKVQLKIRYNRKTSHEALYMNYNSDIKLQNSSLVGIDCWDRQRIKRKAKRTVQKLLSLPAMEQQYIFEEIKKNLF